MISSFRPLDYLSDPSLRLLHRFIEGKQSQDNAVLTAIMVSRVWLF